MAESQVEKKGAGGETGGGAHRGDSGEAQGA